MSLSASAQPAPYPPTNGCSVSVSDGNVGPGKSLNVHGTGFPANTTVGLSVHSLTTSVGSIKTGNDGSFATTVTVPADLTGTHQLIASSPSATCSFAFGVDPSSQHRQATNGSRGSAPHNGATAYTGFEAISASVIAVLLLAGGAALVIVGRRRSQA